MIRIKTALDILCAFIFLVALAVNISRVHYTIGAGALAILITDLLIHYRFNRKIMIPRWILNTTGIASTIVLLSTISINDPVPGLFDISAILLTIKWLEREKTRDYLQILALSLFMLVGFALYTLNITFFVILAVCFLTGTLTLMLLTIFDENNPQELLELKIIQSCFMESLGLLICAVPATAIFFIILPRTDMPILNFLNSPQRAQSGFSDKVSLGDVSAIQENETVILRARITPDISKTDMYWRGVVFDTFDGRRWTASNIKLTKEPAKIADTEGKIVQEVILEPYGEPYIFCLDTPIYVKIRKSTVLFNADRHIFLLKNPITDRVYYRCISTGKHAGATVENFNSYLQLPSELPDALYEIVKKLEVDGDTEKTAKNFSRWLQNSFGYTLSSLPVSEKPLEDFLFKTRKGNCEYFASALGVMLRMAGIPSRLVAGYRGAQYQPIGNYYIVLQNDAHVWVEAFVNNKGWIKLDPTPTVPLSKREKRTRSFLFKLRLYMDFINFYWNQMVILYDLNMQINLFKQARSNIEKWIHLSIRLGNIRNWNVTFYTGKKLKTWTITIISASVVAFIIFAALFFKKVYKKPVEERLYNQFIRKLSRYGVDSRHDSETLKEFALRIIKLLPEDRLHNVLKFINIYSDCVYGKSGLTPKKKRELKRIINQL